jgi:ABC-type branched-subunit amino acid transport system permease subunit
MILYGAGIVLVMIFMPYGIMGIVQRILGRFRSSKFTQEGV